MDKLSTSCIFLDFERAFDTVNQMILDNFTAVAWGVQWNFEFGQQYASINLEVSENIQCYLRHAWKITFSNHHAIFDTNDPSSGRMWKNQNHFVYWCYIICGTFSGNDSNFYQKDLHQIQMWKIENNLTQNYNKSYVLHIGGKIMDPEIKCEKFQTTTQTNYLGLANDNFLNYVERTKMFQPKTPQQSFTKIFHRIWDTWSNCTAKKHIFSHIFSMELNVMVLRMKSIE